MWTVYSAHPGWRRTYRLSFKIPQFSQNILWFWFKYFGVKCDLHSRSKIPTCLKSGKYQIIIWYTFRLCRHVCKVIQLYTHHFHSMHSRWCMTESPIKLCADFILSWTHTSINLQLMCKYTGVLVSSCPRWTLGFAFIALPNTISGKSQGLTDVINMTDAFNF